MEPPTKGEAHAVTDESSAASFNSGLDWLAAHRRAYIESGGVEGHIVDLTFSGGRRFSPHLLLRHVGRRTGTRYINPLFYTPYEGDAVVAASKGGADHNPFWFENAITQQETRFQIATQAFRGTARPVLDGAEREELWQIVTRANPAFLGYQAATSRVIPLLRLTAVEEIPVFSLADAD